MTVTYEPDLAIGSLFSRAWAAFKPRMGLLVATSVIYSLLTGSPNFYWDDSLFFTLGRLLTLLITGPLLAGVCLLALRVVRGEEPDLGELFLGFRAFGKAAGVFLLYSASVALGMILLVVPGIYVGLALAPSIFLILDDDHDIGGTLRKAWYMTEGYRGRLFLIALAIIGLNLLGLLFFIVGIFFTGALTFVIEAVAYEELRHAYEANHAADAYTHEPPESSGEAFAPSPGDR